MAISRTVFVPLKIKPRGTVSPEVTRERLSRTVTSTSAARTRESSTSPAAISVATVSTPDHQRGRSTTVFCSSADSTIALPVHLFRGDGLAGRWMLTIIGV